MPPTTGGVVIPKHRKSLYLISGGCSRTLQLTSLVWVIPVSWAGKWLEAVLIGSIVCDDAQNTTPAVL